MNELTQTNNNTMNGEMLNLSSNRDAIIEIAETAEQRINAVIKIKRFALQVTNSNDWVDQGGKAYLTVSGSQKIARLFGISWQIISKDKFPHEFKSGHYSYECKGIFTMGNISIEEIGTRSSCSPFFSRANGRDKDVSEIDEQNVLKSAIANCIGRGVQSLLGLKNLTWEEVQGGASIKRENVASVSYNKSNSSSGTKPSTKATDKQIYRIKKDFVDLGIKDEAKIIEAINGRHLPGVNKLEKIEDITLAEAKTIIARLEEIKNQGE